MGGGGGRVKGEVTTCAFDYWLVDLDCGAGVEGQVVASHTCTRIDQ